jgi:hypothetical protein
MDRSYRAVDLEGIRLDGLGYAVMITGPPKRKGKLRKKPKGIRNDFDHEKEQEETTSSTDKGGDWKLEILTKTTYDVK